MLPRRAGHAHALITWTWRGALIAAPLILLGQCSLWAFRQANPTFMMSALDARVMVHCTRMYRDAACVLVADFFEVGESRDIVIARMRSAGYKHGTYKDSDEYWSLQYSDYFVGPLGGMSFACSYELTINVLFDQSGKLQKAEGDNNTACL